MRTFSRASQALVLATALVAGTAACGGDSGAGSDPEPVVDLAALEVGSYRTQPKAFEPKNRQFVGRFFEAEALASVMPLTVEIDQSMKVNRPDVVHAFLAPGESHAGPMFTYLDQTGFDTDAPGFVGGFASTGQTDSDQGIGNSMSASVLLFETEAQATAAASALAARGFYKTGGQPEDVTAVKSAKYPDTAFSFHSEKKALAGWYATGKYVIVPVVDSAEDKQLGVSEPDKLLGLAENAIRVVADRLRAFQPTPPDQLAQRVSDPDQMLYRTLPKPDGDSYERPPGVYSAAADLHFAEYPERTRALYERTGVDLVGYGATQLVRTRDAAAAKQYLADVTADKYMVEAEAPKGLPGARCQKYRGPIANAVPYYCYVSYDRYVGFAFASLLPEAQQRISAQYAILANSK